MHYWTLERIVADLLVLLLAVWALDALRGRSLTSWPVFAFVCALSAMLSPFEWTHYQVMLAPLFLVLVVGFVREGARPGAWFGLLAAFVLCSLLWQPYGTLPGTIARVVSGYHESYDALSGAPELTFQEGIAQFAQYILVVTGILWYARGRRLTAATG
jgi:hypothetical protein